MSPQKSRSDDPSGSDPRRLRALAHPARYSSAAPPGERIRVLVVDDSSLPCGPLARQARASENETVEAAGDAEPLVRAASRHSRHDDALERITPREREVLALMAQGRSNAGIAAALVLSDSAVAKHINSIFTKLGIARADHDNRRVLAVLRYHGELLAKLAEAGIRVQDVAGEYRDTG